MHLIKWIGLAVIVMIIGLNKSLAWTIGAKGRVNGPTIHTTYFLTPYNAAFPVRAQALVGYWRNGYCNYNAIYPIGSDMLKTGDFVDIDAYQLRAIVGSGYDCMSVYYTYKQLVIETFRLFWNGFNYNTSFPPQSEVTIL